MIAIILALVVLLIVLGVLFNVKWLLNLRMFITTIILCMLITVLNLLTMTLPTTLIIIMIITMGGLLVKHNHLFSLQRSNFLNKMTKLLILGVLFTSILAYLSTMPIPIINGVFLWLTMIAISTCYALLLYMSWSSALGRISTHKQYDLIMVLGAGIFTEKVTPMLAERLNRALSVYQHQTDKCKIIVSGGQGPDEPISEALAMQRYLIQHGVPNLVLLWNLNLQIRLKTSIIQKGIHNLYLNSPNILCVTSQFHILRGMKLAHTNRMKVDGIGSHTPYHF